jgi:hypothetical protein
MTILGLACASLPGCAPLFLGAGGAVVADQVAEDQQGGDGLF